MDDGSSSILYDLIKERNSIESPPALVSLQNLYDALQIVADSLEAKCKNLEEEKIDLRQQVRKIRMVLFFGDAMCITIAAIVPEATYTTHIYRERCNNVIDINSLS